MLGEYEKDRQTGMDISKISREIYYYTNGYPFLASSICKWIDEKGSRVWTVEMVQSAVKEILKEKNRLLS